MKILHFDNENSFLKELSGKIYAICTHDGHYLCDILEDDYIKLTDDGTLVDTNEDWHYPKPDSNEGDIFFREDVGKSGYEEFKEKYGVLIEINEIQKKESVMGAIDYIRQNIDMDEVKLTINQMLKKREPLYRVNPQLCEAIYDLMEEYCQDNGFPENYWCEYDDEESILFKL